MSIDEVTNCEISAQFPISHWALIKCEIESRPLCPKSPKRATVTGRDISCISGPWEKGQVGSSWPTKQRVGIPLLQIDIIGSHKRSNLNPLVLLISSSHVSHLSQNTIRSDRNCILETWNVAMMLLSPHHGSIRSDMLIKLIDTSEYPNLDPISAQFPLPTSQHGESGCRSSCPIPPKFHRSSTSLQRGAADCKKCWCW